VQIIVRQDLCRRVLHRQHGQPRGNSHFFKGLGVPRPC
jgi:hypothetical protein